MGLLDGDVEDPKAKLRRYVLTGLVFLALVAASLWWVFRFYPEKKVVETFLQALQAGDTQRAYQIWHATPSYSYQDFLEDWGPGGEYGPVKSYTIEDVGKPPKGSGVVVVIGVAPFAEFPSPQEPGKYRHVKEVRLWVEMKDKSMGFAP